MYCPCANILALRVLSVKHDQFLKRDQLHTQVGKIAFLSVTNSIPIAWPIAFLKQDGSQGHTPPTKNPHCKITSLALSHLAIIWHSCTFFTSLSLDWKTKHYTVLALSLIVLALGLQCSHIEVWKPENEARCVTVEPSKADTIGTTTVYPAYGGSYCNTLYMIQELLVHFW